MRERSEILTEMQSARDEVRVRLHLFSLDARERLQELELSLESLERKLNEGGEKAAQAISDRARSVIGSMKELLHGQAGLSSPARSVMSAAVRTCSPSDSVNRAAQIFWENDCGVVPVVDGEAKLLGMLTDRDVCMAAYTQGRPLAEIAVESAMSKHIQAVLPDDSVEEVLATMSRAQVHRLPVVDAERRLLGIIALADLARWVRGLQTTQLGAGEAVLAAVIAISGPPAAASALEAAE